jgi:hypothetical protein
MAKAQGETLNLSTIRQSALQRPTLQPRPKALTCETGFIVKARRGYKRAAEAIAHKILVAIYHLLSRKFPTSVGVRATQLFDG